MENTDWLKYPTNADEFWEFVEISYEHELMEDMVEMLNEMDLPPDLSKEEFYKEWERRFSLHLRQ